MNAISKLSIGAAVAATFIINTNALSQTAGDNPSGAVAAPADDESAQGGFELRQAPEIQLDGTQALQVKPGGLTADEVARRAVKTSPTVRARQAEIAAAQAKVDDAVAKFIPRLTLKASYQRLSEVDNALEGAMVGTLEPSNTIRIGPCPPPNSTEQCAVTESGMPIGASAFEFPSLVDNYALNASLSLPISDYLLRISSSIAATQENRRAAELQKQAEILKVESDARVAYYNWLRTVSGGAVAQASLQRFKALLDDARAAYEVGTVTKADVLRLEAAVAGTELAITETETLRRLSEEQLATYMDEPVKAYQVGENAAVDAARVSVPKDLNKLIANAYQQRLELQALKAASASIREGSDAIAISQYPRLDAFGDVTVANPNQRIFPQEEEWNATWAVGLSLSWNVNDALSGSAQSAELEATRAKLEADTESLERGIKLEVTSAYLDIKKARVAIETSLRASAAAKEAYRVARDLYRVGRATTTDLISAESELVEASIKQINASLDYRVAKVKLAHAVGKKVSEI
jgi:outer membrane protein